MSNDQFHECVSRQERDIARQQNDRAFSTGQKGLGLLKRVCRPELRLLNGRDYILVYGQMVAHGFPGVASHNGYRVGDHNLGRSQHVIKQGYAAGAVQHLREGRLHAGTLTRG